MSAHTAISIDEFWEKYADSDEGRWEYDDGQLIELPMPDYLHIAIVGRICALLTNRWPTFLSGPELDCKVTYNQVRRPDVAAVKFSEVQGRYPDPEHPVYLAVEVLSPGHSRSVAKTFVDAVSKYRDAYAPWGVPYCWILDPHTRTAWHSENGFRQPVAHLEAGEIALEAAEIFEVLSSMPEGERK